MLHFWHSCKQEQGERIPEIHIDLWFPQMQVYVSKMALDFT